MRPVTAGEQTVLESAGYRVIDRVWIKNGSGTWKDLTALGSPALSYLIDGYYDKNIDQPVSQFTAVLRRSEGALSLAPLNETSTLNRLDDGTTYSPLLDPGRSIKWERATVAWGATPAAGDWKPKFEGVVDEVDSSDHQITVEARDLGGRLVDHLASSPGTFNITASPQALETFLQERILDAAFGAGAIPLWTPVSPSYNIKTFAHDREPIMDIAQRLVLETKAWDLRYWWKADTSQWRLRLADPNRTKTIPDFTLPASMYVGARRLKLDRRQVRNRIEITFGPSSARQTATADDAVSQARFGYRVLPIQLEENSPITTLAEAQAMADAILSDLALPKADVELELLPYWPVELFDLARINANTKYFTANQDLAVVGLRHTLGEKKRTYLAVRGKPAGAYRSWWTFALPDPGPSAPPPTAKLTLQTRYPTKELIYLEGALGSPDQGPLEYRTKEEPAAWSAWGTSPALPRYVEVTRPPSYTKGYRLQTRQADGQVSEYAYIGVTARQGGDGAVTNPDMHRAGQGGVFVRDAFIHPLTQYNREGTTPLIDTLLGRVTADLSGSDGYANILGRRGVLTRAQAAGGAARAIVHDGVTRRGDGGMDTRAAFIPAAGVYTRDGVTPLIDPDLGRVTSSLAGPAGTGMSNIETGGNRGLGGFTNTSGGLVNTAADSRAALLNNHFRYGTDGAAGVVESGAQSFIHQSYLDASRRPTTMRRTTAATDVTAETLGASIGVDVENMIENGGGQEGETGGGAGMATGWTHGSGNNLQATTAAAKFGDRSLQHVNSPATQSFGYKEFAVDDGAVFELSGWMKTVALVGGVGASVYVEIVSGVTSFTIFEQVTDLNMDATKPNFGIATGTGGGSVDWRFGRAMFKVNGAGTIRVYCRLGVNAQNTSGTVYYDGLKLRRVTVASGPAPVMDVVGTPGTTAFTVTYTVTADSFQYSIDGGAYAAVPASPFTVSRNAPGGASKVLTFRATRNGQTVTSQLVVPPQELSVSLSITGAAAGPGPSTYNTLDVTWSASGMPTGTTFNVGYDHGGNNMDDATGLTGSTHQFTSVVFSGTPGKGAVFVDAIYNGQVIASAKRNRLYTG